MTPEQFKAIAIVAVVAYAFFLIWKMIYIDYKNNKK